MLKKFIAVCALASAAFVGLSIPTFTTAPAGAEQLALFTCTDMGNGWAMCESFDGEVVFLLQTK